MDCINEWADRVNEEQLKRVLDLGEFLAKVKPEEKPMRMTLIATKLWGEGVARSQEEAYVMLTESMVHYELAKMIRDYDTLLHKYEEHASKLLEEYQRVMNENSQLRQLLRISTLPEKRRTVENHDA